METREVYQQRRQAVADIILAQPEHFDMNYFIYGAHAIGEEDPMCGTTMCLAGWAVLQIPGVRLARSEETGLKGETYIDMSRTTIGLMSSRGGDMSGTAAWWLGVREGYAHDLFYGAWLEPFDRPLGTATAEEAVAALMAAPYVCDPLEATPA